MAGLQHHDITDEITVLESNIEINVDNNEEMEAENDDFAEMERVMEYEKSVGKRMAEAGSEEDNSDEQEKSSEEDDQEEEYKPENEDESDDEEDDENEESDFHPNEEINVEKEEKQKEDTLVPPTPVAKRGRSIKVITSRIVITN